MRSPLVVAAAALAFARCACPPPPSTTPDPGHSSVTVDRASGIVADGVDPVVVTVTVRTAAGEPVAGQQVTLAVTGQQNALSPTGLTNADGVTTATLTTRVAETKTITAQISEGELADRPTATFVPGPPSGVKSTVTVNPASAVADGLTAVTVSVVLRDANDNLVPGAQVALSASGTGNTLVQPSLTDGAGSTSGSVSSTHAETKRVTAVATAGSSSVTLLQQPLVQFVAGPAARLAFVVPPSSAAIGDVIVPAIEVAVQDANGNLAATSTASVRLTFGSRPAAGASLLGTVTRAAQNGIASFDDLSVDKAGSGATLVATSTGLAGATSPPFNITPGPGPRLVFLTQPQSASSGATLGLIQVALQDASGNTIPTASDSVTVALAGGPGGAVLSGSTSIAASSGVATFSNLSIAKAGTGYSLVVTCPGYAGATSQSFAVTAGSPSQLAFLVQPGQTAAGAAMAPAIQVAVQDSSGNLATSDTRQVTVALGANPGGGTLSGTTATSASAGVAVFNNLSINKAATGYSLMATAGGLQAATSNVFAITPGPATQLTFSVQPGTTTAGASMAPAVQVTALDQFGNAATGSTPSVTVALETNPAGGTLSGTTTASAVAGVAQFGNLSIATAGTGYSLSAVATGLTRAVSSAFAVVPAAASQLAFIAQPPPNGTAGVPLSPPVRVGLYDSFGNLATADTRNVSVALQGGTGGAALSGTTTVAASAGVAPYADLSVNLGGSGYRLAASASGLTGALSNAFAITPADVTCSQTVHYVTRSGVIDRPGDLSDRVIAAWVPNGDGGYTYYPGTAGAPGTCVIPNVPQGLYLFEYGYNFFDTASRSVDLSFSKQGRPDQGGGADSGTALVATLSNLLTTTNRDRFLAHSFDVDDVFPTAPPLPGKTTDTIFFSWRGNPLLDAAKGDAFDILQLSPQNPPEYQTPDGGPGPLFYRAATRAYEGSVTLQDGVSTNVDGGMTILQQGTQTLSWKLSASTPGSFAALTAQVHPLAYLYNLSFYEGPLVDASRGFYATTPRSMWLSWGLAGDEPDIAITASWGNPYPAPYVPIARTYGNYEVSHDVPLVDGGVNTIYTDVDIAVRDLSPSFPYATMQPLISPVRTPLINGADLFANRSGVGRSPLLQWSPPAIGTATYYAVDIWETTNDSTSSFPYGIGSVETANTQVRLPPILVPGRYYVFVITAHYSPGHDTPNRPWELHWPDHEAMAVSGLISP